MRDVERRLRALEAATRCRPIPSYEQWQKERETMDTLSKALYVAQSTDSELFNVMCYDEDSKKFGRVIASYLDRMGELE